MDTKTDNTDEGIIIKGDDSSKTEYVIGSCSAEGSINIGPDEEKVEKMKELGRRQIKKIEDLQDHMIEFLVDSDPSISQKQDWKSDFSKISDKKSDIQKGIEIEVVGKIHMLGQEPLEKRLLNPDQLESLNQMFNRWK